MDECSVIEYSLDGGRTWYHGRYVQAWVTEDGHALSGQRAVVREFAAKDHGDVERIITRVLAESDPRAVFNQPV